MPIWIIVGLIPPFLWAIVNHIDKFLLSKTKPPSSVNVLMVYSTGFALVILPLTLFLGYGEIFQNRQQNVVQFVGGLFLTASIYCYLLALSRDEASRVLPLALLVPVFGYFFSYFLLQEMLTVYELMACALIVFGALILSLEFNEEGKRIRINYITLFLMIGCSIFQAAHETLFKFSTIKNSFIVSIFWQYIGVLMFGVVLLLIKNNLWKEFNETVRRDGTKMFGLNFTSETLAAVGYIVRDFSLLLAPIVIIMTLNGYQPLFVFVIGTILTFFFPHISTEKITWKHLLHKISAIVVMIVGTILIAYSL